jgi:hypothetical protein
MCWRATRRSAFAARVLSLAVAGCLSLLAVDSSQAQVAPSPTTGNFNYSTSPLARNASCLQAGAAVLIRATDIGVDFLSGDRLREPSKRGAVLRLAKLVMFDLPVADFARGLNHELGHLARGAETGVVLRLRVLGHPWSGRGFDLSSDRLLSLPAVGAGFEAERVLERGVQERISEESRSGPADAIFLLDGAVMRVRYIRAALSVIPAAPGPIAGDAPDAARYVYGLVNEGWVAPAQIHAVAERVRTASYMNFADVGLWEQVWYLVKYVRTGQRVIHNGWLHVGGLGLMPFARYDLAPYGPETGVGTRYQKGETVGEVSIRWTEQGLRSRLLGVGLWWSAAPRHGIRPRLRVDVWRSADQPRGIRVESGILASNWPSWHAALEITVGAKSQGYILGLPNKSGTYAQSGLRLRF